MPERGPLQCRRVSERRMGRGVDRRLPQVEGGEKE